MSSVSRTIPRILFSIPKFIGVFFSFLNRRRTFLRSFRNVLLRDKSIPRSVAKRLIKAQEKQSSLMFLFKGIGRETGFGIFGSRRL